MLTLIIISAIIIWFIFGYKAAEYNKDYMRYQYSLVLGDKIIKNYDTIFYYFLIFCGLVSYFTIKIEDKVGYKEILKIYEDKLFYIDCHDHYKKLYNEYGDEKYNKKALGYLERIFEYEQRVEIPFYKKYKIDICNYCSKREECCLEHYDYDYCIEFNHKNASGCDS